MTRLLELAERGRAMCRASNRTSRDWYRIVAKDDLAEVFIYDFIDDFGVNASDFVADLRAITAKRIDLHVNSGGGLVFDAIAMYSALKNHPATVTTFVDGVAASAASFVAMAGDEVVMEKPAKVMIHDARGLVVGPADDMRQMADLLDELSDTIADIYADKSGGKASDFRDAMRRETWYSAAEAVAAGLADRVAGESKSAESARSQAVRVRARHQLTGVR